MTSLQSAPHASRSKKKKKEKRPKILFEYIFVLRVLVGFVLIRYVRHTDREMTVMKEEACFTYASLETGGTACQAPMGRHLGQSGGRGARGDVGDSLYRGFYKKGQARQAEEAGDWLM